VATHPGLSTCRLLQRILRVSLNHRQCGGLERPGQTKRRNKLLQGRIALPMSSPLKLDRLPINFRLLEENCRARRKIFAAHSEALRGHGAHVRRRARDWAGGS
jgi:hypothetical protein